jgi:uroporphyrinogen III methyltransferase / synthase
VSGGKVWLVGAGPGDPGLITVRGMELLGKADVVLHDALAHSSLLDACRPGAEVKDVGKRPGLRSTSQAAITAELIALARAGKRVVRLKGGDPLLFARGAEEALALSEAGVPFEIVPAVPSPVGSAAYAGISLTHRELSSSVTFITGSDREEVAWSPEAWRKLATATDTICVLMGMRNIEAITQAIIEGGRAPTTPAAVLHWGTRPEQRVAVATLADIASVARERGLTNPSIIVVGEVVALREKLRWFDVRPLFGKRVLVPRPADQARDTARAIRERGAAPVVIPALETVAVPPNADVDRTLAALTAYDWVLFTSRNGVEHCFEALARAGKDARAFGPAKVAAVGRRTAEALAARGVLADAVAEEQVGEGLVREVLSHGTPRRVLWVRPRVARDALPAELAAVGAVVDEVVVYETRVASGASRAAQAVQDGAIDVVLFTSGSMVEILVDALGSDARSALSGVVVASIGAVTTAAAEKLGIRVDVKGTSRGVDGLLDALEEHLASGALPVSDKE